MALITSELVGGQGRKRLWTLRIRYPATPEWTLGIKRCGLQEFGEEKVGDARPSAKNANE
jgi:hypothetical protein